MGAAAISVTTKVVAGGVLVIVEVTIAGVIIVSGVVPVVIEVLLVRVINNLTHGNRTNVIGINSTCRCHTIGNSSNKVRVRDL